MPQKKNENINTLFLQEKISKLKNEKYEKIESYNNLANIFKNRIERAICLFKNLIIISFLILMLNHIPILLCKEVRLKKLSNIEEINLKVKSTRNSVTTMYMLKKNKIVPYEIEIDGEPVVYSNTNGYKLNTGEYNVKLTFNSDIKFSEG